MKLKKPLVLGLALCMMFGLSVAAVACDKTPAHTAPTDCVDADDNGKCDVCDRVMDNHAERDNDGDGKCDVCGKTIRVEKVSYTVNITGADAEILKDISDVLFVSANGTIKRTALSGTSATVTNMDQGNYTVFLRGSLPGYTIVPAKLTATTTTAELKVEKVTPKTELDATGNSVTKVPYQIIVLYPLSENKMFLGNGQDGEEVQICTSAGETTTYGCYDLYFDANHIACVDIYDAPVYLEAAKYDVHFTTSMGLPEGYTFDKDEYKISAEGGFMSVECH